MIKRLILAALALACAAPAQAQSVAGLPVFAPAGKIPATVIYCDNGAGLAQICTTGGGGGGGGTTATSTAAAPTYTEGSTTAPLSLNLSGDLRTLAKQNCSVVSADAAYTVGTYQPCTMTASGRIRIGMSSAGNVTPGAPPTSQTTADTVGCIYRSSSPTYANGNTGALGCDVSGNLLIGSTALGSPADSAWSGTGSGTMIQLLKAIATGAADTSASDVRLTAAASGATVVGTVNLGTLNGAATAAKQPALGTAGTSSTDVLSVQGVAGGTPQPVDTVIKGTATDRSSIVGFTGSGFTTTSGSTTVTLTTVPTSYDTNSGGIVDGQIITGTGIPAGTTITLLSGSRNATSSTYTLSAAATATGTSVAITSSGPQTIAASNASRRGLAYQNQSTTADCYTNGVGTATTNYRSLKIAAGAYYETVPTHVGTGAVSVICTTAAASFYAREW